MSSIRTNSVLQPMTTLVICCLAVLFFQHLGLAANIKKRPAQPPRSTGSGGMIYPQYLLKGKPDRWIAEQMPIRVWVSHGLTLDAIADSMGVPLTNTANKENWPDLVINVVSQPQQIQTLPVADGYSEQQYQAALQGIGLWKQFEREKLFSFEFTDNPEEADIYVFWTPKFVNKLGLALFENDIRGYTSVYALPYNDVRAALERGNVELVKRSLKPVVTFLRTQEQDGSPISYEKMRASAAHEFGHALGIADHSPTRTDLMSIYYGYGTISPNDAATIRHLYRNPPYFMP